MIINQQKQKKEKNQKGFTLVELLLALAVFSFVLIFITTAFLQIFRTYSRGITRKEVNQTARLAINDISSNLRVVENGSQVDNSLTGNGRLCIGSTSYVWNPVVRPSGWVSDNQVNGEVVNFVRIDGDTGQVACDSEVTNIVLGNVTSVFPENIGVLDVSVNQVGGVGQIYDVSFTASTNQLDFLDTINECDAGQVESAYCAQITLNETIGIRNR